MLVTQSCPTLCHLMHCSPPGSSVHGVLQARILEWVTISFSRGSSQLRGQTWVTCTAGRSEPSEPPRKLYYRNKTLHNLRHWGSKGFFFFFKAGCRKSKKSQTQDFWSISVKRQMKLVEWSGKTGSSSWRSGKREESCWDLLPLQVARNLRFHEQKGLLGGTTHRAGNQEQAGTSQYFCVWLFM